MANQLFRQPTACNLALMTAAIGIPEFWNTETATPHRNSVLSCIECCFKSSAQDATAEHVTNTTPQYLPSQAKFYSSQTLQELVVGQEREAILEDIGRARFTGDIVQALPNNRCLFAPGCIMLATDTSGML